MQFKLNKSWTSVSIHRYVGYDRAKAHSKVEQVAVIPLFPEVPEEIPVSVAALLSYDQQVETLAELDTIRLSRPGHLLEYAIAQATKALRNVVVAASPGLDIRAAAAVEGLRAAAADVAQALTMPREALTPVAKSTSAELGLVGAALAAVNALVDANRDGLDISREDATELQQQLELICELHRDQKPVVSPDSAARSQ